MQDRQALHTYQRLVRQAEGYLGESNGEQNWSEATKTCHRLLGLLELEENRNHKWNATAAAPTTSSSTIPGAVRRLKREVCSKLQATKDAGGRDQEERRTKLLSCSAFDVERREGTLPGAGRPLFHCPPSGTLSVDTLLASVRTPWLHAALAAPPPSTSTSTSTSTAPAPSSSSSSSSYTAAPAASSLRGKMPAPSSTSYPSSSTSSYSHAGGSSSSGGSAPSLARNNGDRPVRLILSPASHASFYGRTDIASLLLLLTMVGADGETTGRRSTCRRWSKTTNQLRTEPVQQSAGRLARRRPP